MAICLEVAEHLKESSASTLVENLTNASDLLVFSAAIPYQGGQNHVNEQWPVYWQELFSKMDYRMVDVLRFYFWEDPNIFFWYKQNMFVVVKRGSVEEKATEKLQKRQDAFIHSLVHPDIYLRDHKAMDYYKREMVQKETELENILSGKRGGRFYFSLLKKYLKRKTREII